MVFVGRGQMHMIPCGDTGYATVSTKFTNLKNLAAVIYRILVSRAT